MPKAALWIPKATACLVLFLILPLEGCLHIQRPAVPPTLTRKALQEYTVAEFQTDYAGYKTAVASGQYDQAVVRRDAMINRVSVDIERNYREYEAALHTTRATTDIAGDITELGIAATASVMGDAGITELLAASLTAFKGSRLSVDKNYFREKTTEALIAKMQAQRDRIRNRITEKMSSLGVRQYNFEEAWKDLVQFFYAGTLPGGIQALTNDAGADATAVRKETEALDELRVASQQDVTSAVSVRSEYEKLHKEVQSENAAARESATVRLKSIIRTLGLEPTVSPNPSTDEMLGALRSYMQGALQDRERLEKLKKALAQ
jgi:hypothetical protein